MAVAKIVELMGSSDKSFDDALMQVVQRANKTLRHVTGMHIISQKIKMNEGKIAEYRVNVKIAFRLEDPKKK